MKSEGVKERIFVMIKIGMLISGRYEIIEKAGTGGMADVYKAMDNRLNRYVAIKVLKQEYSLDTKFVTKFRAEAQSVAGLTHPNIVAVYDVGDENGLYYIVMEFVEGITLKKYIEHKGKLDIMEALGIAIQIAQGLLAAHDNHIIHRDIKPQNIIISREGKVKVTDFGIAKATSSNTITSNVMGSVHYISPEQARGGFSDEKSDIYSLGITMYEMLTGTVPFTGDSTVSVALAHIQEEAPPLSAFEKDIPKSIEMIVSKCIQKKPELRYLNVSDLINDLKKAIADPEGDFVKIAPALGTDGPTIHISDEDLKDIKSRSKAVIVSNEEDNLDLSDIEKEADNDSDIDPKLEKAVVIGSIVAGVILAMIVIFIIVKFVMAGRGTDAPAEESALPTVAVTAEADPDDDTETTSGVVLDDLTEMDKQEAMAYLNSLDMDISIDIDEEYSDDIEKGKVIKSNPSEGTTLRNGDSVTLVISSGPEPVAIPSVAGKSPDDARKILEEAGLTTEVSYENSDTVDVEKVIGTKPEEGKEVADGSKVTIIVSKGKKTEYVKVPDLTGLTQKKAIKALEKVGLSLGKVTEENSDTVPSGSIISQTQIKGSEVEKGTIVGVTVSIGPEITYKYIGSITISDNPFTDESQSGMIKLVLSQDGSTKVVGEETMMNFYSFPLQVSAEGFSESEGEITMYVDGVKYHEYNISFAKVAE